MAVGVLVLAVAGCTAARDGATGPSSSAGAVTSGRAQAPAAPGAKDGATKDGATGGGSTGDGSTGDGSTGDGSAPPGAGPSASALPDHERAPGQQRTRPSLGELLASASPRATSPSVAGPSLAGPSLTGPAPADATARGALAAGFPTQVVPVPDGLSIVSSSVASEGTHVRVGLEASGEATPDDVVGSYSTTLTAAGFVAAPSPAVAGSSATAFTRGPDGIVVTVRPRTGGGTDLVVSAALTTAG